MTKEYANYFETNQGIVVLFTDGTMKQVDKTSSYFEAVKEHLDKQEFDQLYGCMDLASRITTYSDGLFYVLDGQVYVGKEVIPDALGTILVRLATSNMPVEPLVKFWHNLSKNPNEQSKQSLYGFLAANQVPITKDGCFLAYKRIDNDWKDCYSHTIDNSIGAKVTMDRDKVDPNPNQTCSAGLHAAAFEYADGVYNSRTGRLVEVKISPENVVAVPTDYHEQKMRVCEYVVIRECEGKRLEALVMDVEFDDYDDNYDDDYDYDVDDDQDVVEVADAPVDTPVDTPNDTTSVDVEKDGRGRVAIPKSIVQLLGVGPFDRVAAYVDTVMAMVIVERVGKNVPDEHTIYTVDRSCNVRVTNSLLAKAGIDTYEDFGVRFADNSIIIE